LGSLFLSRLQMLGKKQANLIMKISLSLTVMLVLLITMGYQWLDAFVGWAFIPRVLIVCLLLFPMGFLLGMFFPAGLSLTGGRHPGAIAWAWGINCGFTVLGSILSIILSQFLGFNFILAIAGLIYIIAAVAFRRMEQGLASTKV